MSQNERRFGLIGYPLEHSGSADLFRKKFLSEGLLHYSYSLFPLRSIELLPSFLQQQTDLTGFNVTIPFKERIIPFLDSLDDIAGETGAVNTVLVERSAGRKILKGFNTDAEGFELSLPAGFDFTSCLILGTGGASKAVARTMRKKGVNVMFVSRTHQDANTVTYGELTPKIIGEHRFVVNCSPLGMYPDIADCPPLPFEFLGSGHFVYDLIYNPPQTVFLRKAAEAGARTQNGQSMLENQAALSFRIWTGRE